MKHFKNYILLTVLVLTTIVSYGQYFSWKQNPDGTYVCGGAYEGWKQNPDGTYVVGWGKCKK